MTVLGWAAPAEAAPDDDAKLEDPSTYEFAFVSVGVTQAWTIAGRFLHLGLGGGIGPALYRISQMECSDVEGECSDEGTRDPGIDPSLEIAYGAAFVRLSPARFVDLDLGPKIGIATTLYDVPEAPRANFTFGGYADLRIGSSTIKFGPRFEYGRAAYADFYQNGWKLTALMLRVVH